MQMRCGVGWQYALADLSLILFMVSAAALAQSQPKAKAIPMVSLADPMAVWRPGPGAPVLTEWLAGQALDPRQRLTIIAHFAGSDPAPAFARAQALARQATGNARIIVEPGMVDDLSALLTWDGEAMARPLQQDRQKSSQGPNR